MLNLADWAKIRAWFLELEQIAKTYCLSAGGTDEDCKT